MGRGDVDDGFGTAIWRAALGQVRTVSIPAKIV
jgi:hypothetical protein